MDPKLLVKVARRWGWLGAIPVLFVALYLSTSYRPPVTTYQVVMRFTTGSAPATQLSPDYDRYYAWLTSEYIANGLADFAQTGHFARGVSDRLADDGISVPPEAVQGSIVTDNAQSVLVVYLAWPDHDQALLIAEAVSTELLEVGPQYYPQMQGAGVVARQADAPRATPLAPGLRAQLLGPGLRLALAFAAGIALVLTAHYIDPWVREPAEIARLGVDIVGIIPRASNRPRTR